MPKINIVERTHENGSALVLENSNGEKIIELFYDGKMIADWNKIAEIKEKFLTDDAIKNDVWHQIIAAMWYIRNSP